MQDADARFPRPRTVTGSPGNRSQALQTTEIRAHYATGRASLCSHGLTQSNAENTRRYTEDDQFTMKPSIPSLGNLTLDVCSSSLSSLPLCISVPPLCDSVSTHYAIRTTQSFFAAT